MIYNILNPKLGFIKGHVGTGKTHLAQALGHQACRQGITVRFTRANALLRQFDTHRQQGAYDALLKQYAKPSLLIIDDDFGLWLLVFLALRVGDDYRLVQVRWNTHP